MARRLCGVTRRSTAGCAIQPFVRCSISVVPCGIATSAKGVSNGQERASSHVAASFRFRISSRSSG